MQFCYIPVYDKRHKWLPCSQGILIAFDADWRWIPKSTINNNSIYCKLSRILIRLPCYTIWNWDLLRAFDHAVYAGTVREFQLARFPSVIYQDDWNNLEPLLHQLTGSLVLNRKDRLHPWLNDPWFEWKSKFGHIHGSSDEYNEALTPSKL